MNQQPNGEKKPPQMIVEFDEVGGFRVNFTAPIPFAFVVNFCEVMKAQQLGSQFAQMQQAAARGQPKILLADGSPSPFKH